MRAETARLLHAMADYDRDPALVHHFTKVHGFASAIGVMEGLDEETLFGAMSDFDDIMSGRNTAHPSALAELSVIIDADGEDCWIPRDGWADYRSRRREELIERIHQFGVAGLGGAGFPTGVKLQGGGDKIETLIINAAECEPYITADDRLMQDCAAQGVEGIRILAHILQPREILIGIEDICQQNAVAILKLNILMSSSTLKIATIESHLIASIVHTRIYALVIPIFDSTTIDIIDSITIWATVAIHIGVPPLTTNRCVYMLKDSTRQSWLVTVIVGMTRHNMCLIELLEQVDDILHILLGRICQRNMHTEDDKFILRNKSQILLEPIILRIGKA